MFVLCGLYIGILQIAVQMSPQIFAGLFLQDTDMIRFAFPLSVFRKLVYMACIFVLPRIMDIRSVFYAGSISDAVGAAFNAAVFFCIVDPRLKKELMQKET